MQDTAHRMHRRLMVAAAVKPTAVPVKPTVVVDKPTVATTNNRCCIRRRSYQLRRFAFEVAFKRVDQNSSTASRSNNHNET